MAPELVFEPNPIFLTKAEMSALWPVMLEVPDLSTVGQQRYHFRGDTLGKFDQIQVVRDVAELDIKAIASASTVIFTKNIDRFAVEEVGPFAKVIFPYGSSITIGGVDGYDRVITYIDPLLAYGGQVVKSAHQALSTDRRKLAYHRTQGSDPKLIAERITEVGRRKQEYFQEISSVVLPTGLLPVLDIPSRNLYNGATVSTTTFP